MKRDNEFTDKNSASYIDAATAVLLCLIIAGVISLLTVHLILKSHGY